jgi:Zn-dependent protease with chaperone function
VNDSAQVSAWFYNGTSSKRLAVRLSVSEQILHIEGLDAPLSFPLSEVRINDRLGNTPRNVELPDGSRCESLDNDVIDSWLAQSGTQSGYRLIHKLESRMAYALIALVASVTAVWLGITVGTPALAKVAAQKLPPAVENTIGEQTLVTLDKIYFHPTKLDDATQKEVTETFARINQSLQREKPLELKFRNGGMLGANAMALPSGIVVVTDELVELAKNQEELFSVLSHEAGHVMHNHLMRGWLQDSMVALIVATIASDASSLSVLAAGLPLALVNAKHSREFETEADDFAYNKMLEQKIPLRNFANIMSRLEQSARGKDDMKEEAKKSKKDQSNQRDKDPLDFLSSHPATAERIKRFQVD